MKYFGRFVPLLFLLLAVPFTVFAQLTPPSVIPYGANPAAGEFAKLNGIELYYEIYGAGPPLLYIHGNGANIGSAKPQIEFFAQSYRVIVADSRGHGKSGLGTGPLTFEQMTEDLNALLEQLQVKPVLVLGMSDGGIIGLMLAIHHPDKVSKLAVMGTNLNPAGAHPWALEFALRREKLVDEMIAKGDQTRPWALQKQRLGLLAYQPNIAPTELERISIPVLVMAGDKDVIRLEHTQQIFDHLKQAHLAIFPGATHSARREYPDLFNQTVDRFFREPFTRPDSKDNIR